MSARKKRPRGEPTLTHAIRAWQIAKLLKGKPELADWLCKNVTTEKDLHTMRTLVSIRLARTKKPPPS